MDQLKADLGITRLNVVIGRISDFDMENKTSPHWTRIREIQVSMAESMEHCAWVNTDDLNDRVDPSSGEMKNWLHYGNEGYKIFGERLAEAALGLLK